MHLIGVCDNCQMSLHFKNRAGLVGRLSTVLCFHYFDSDSIIPRRGKRVRKKMVPDGRGLFGEFMSTVGQTFQTSEMSSGAKSTVKNCVRLGLPHRSLRSGGSEGRALTDYFCFCSLVQVQKQPIIIHNQ